MANCCILRFSDKQWIDINFDLYPKRQKNELAKHLKIKCCRFDKLRKSSSQWVSVVNQHSALKQVKKYCFFFSRWSRVRAHLLSPPLNFVTCLSLLFTILRRRGISTMQKESLKKQSRAYFQDEEFLRNINLSTNHQLTTLLNT